MTNLYIEEDQKFRIDSDIQVEKSFSLLKANAKVNPKDLTYTVFDERFATVEKDSNGNGIVIPKSGTYGVAIILVKDSNSGYGSILRLGIRPKNSVAMPMVSAGSAHVVALKANGTVWTWGYNGNGELGDGKNRNTNIPVQVLTGAQDSNSGYLENIIQVAAGAYHNLALAKDGTVWAWGYGSHGELGNRIMSNSSLPVKVIGVSDVVSIAAGYYNSFAVRKDGTVWSWGYNNYGQLGLGNDTSRTTAQQVLGGASGSQYLTDIVEVKAATMHTLALKGKRNSICVGL